MTGGYQTLSYLLSFTINTNVYRRASFQTSTSGEKETGSAVMGVLENTICSANRAVTGQLHSHVTWASTRLDSPAPRLCSKACLGRQQRKHQSSALHTKRVMHKCCHVVTTSSIGNIFHVPGPLWGESNSHGGFPPQRPMARRFDAFFGLYLNKRLSKQSRRRWFETPSC